MKPEKDGDQELKDVARRMYHALVGPRDFEKEEKKREEGNEEEGNEEERKSRPKSVSPSANIYENVLQYAIDRPSIENAN